MRLYLEFESRSPIVLNLNYNTDVRHFIHSVLDQSEFTKLLEKEGFASDNKVFRLFTFSRIMGSFKIIEDEGKKRIIFKDPVKLIISSPLEMFMVSMIRGILKKDMLDFCGNQVWLKKIDLKQKKSFSTICKIKMLTPIVVYKKEESSLHPKRRFVSPFEEDFLVLVRENIRSKLKALYICEEDFNFSIEPVDVVESRDRRVVKIYNDAVIGWMGSYIIRGTKKSIEIAYYSGLGAKNSMGFGMFEIVK